ncbi:hypothetical protein NJB14197_01770 [Mycobacterium montefiorense]|uniref:Uncharacterized protein n=1 Tax=Mycobacterium montefiorense TaxID=154654 RepID=A0AA37PM23_9MYCO|nr:hypothetical protein MmonteBS_23550 [Mycobacterium montefiorense]GKU33868.1 hypothetical protein NJB14191_12140 [Mycobacterium montefiorense]GKU41353.1 hypothetical protein NJB14192_33370 [Mycobacterium montefiorense]GKU46263.1 hypothetical protein NJB14194_28830 [Mycobacterium montefiorense]GKU52420.1 hypothetical protein NJB14195_36630 [Mycobacterium montefiorense]
MVRKSTPAQNRCWYTPPGRKAKQPSHKQRQDRVDAVRTQQPSGAGREHRDDAEDQGGDPQRAKPLAQEHRAQDRRGDRVHRDHHRTQHRRRSEQQRLVETAELHGLDQQTRDEDVTELSPARPGRPGQQGPGRQNDCG